MSFRSLYNYFANKPHMLLIVIFTVKLLVIVFGLKGYDWEPDSYMHFLQVRSVFVDFPHNLEIGISVWAKPLYTFPLGLLVFVLSTDNIVVVQIFNALVFSLISWLVYKIVLKVYESKTFAVVALMLTSFSFLLFTSSVSALTEPIFTLSLVVGFYYIIHNRLVLASAAFGLSVLGRIEGLYFLAVFIAWAAIKIYVSSDALHFKFRLIELLKAMLPIVLIGMMPVVVWNLIGYAQTGYPLFIFDAGYPKDETGIYGYGRWLSFPVRLIIHEPVIWLSFLLSIFTFIKAKLKFKLELALIYAFALGFLLTQILFWKTGRFGSAGLMRYLISITPFMIICSIVFYKYLFELKVLKYRAGLLAILVIFAQIVALLINVFGFVGIITAKWNQPEYGLRQAGEWIQLNNPDNLPVLGVHPEALYFAKLTGASAHSYRGYTQDISEQKPGYYLWHSIWGPGAGVSYEFMLENAKLVEQFGEYTYIFQVN